MAYRLLTDAPPGGTIEHVTFVAFLPDGACAALPGPALISGAVLPGESIDLDASARIPMETAGFFRQRIRVFAADGTHAYAWLSGDRYTGPRRHAAPDLEIAAPDRLADALDRRGLSSQARAVRDAVRLAGALDDDDHYADVVQLLEPAYLRAGTAEAGSGFGGTPEQWRASREMVVDGIDRDGTFLDVGCANGLLMESVHRWAAERGLQIEPYGIDLGPRLVAVAQARLPHWADRIRVGNAMTYTPPDGRRFTFVHVIVDLAPPGRLADLLHHALHALVEPGGRLLVSRYSPTGGTDRGDAAELVRQLGRPVSGSSGRRTAGEVGSTAWIDQAPAS